jgi:hypothetical protein
MTARKAALAIATAVGAVLVLASVAWACTDFVKIDTLIPAADPTAATAAVKGSGAAANSTVELRWNSRTGPVIGTAQADASGAYTAQAVIPDAPAGIYTVIASDGRSDVGRAPVEVAPDMSGIRAMPAGVADVAIQPSPKQTLNQSSSAFSSAAPLMLAAGFLALASGLTLLIAKRRKAFTSR